ncbi:uncharacterized protein LOC122882710 isoform X2 [Siniperca chuatsi]|uniref:uncharacterized protein LOC122882710 isoform X2 n=1 Tax=Siniperca chuatsi TaxID=119488 RepID=UPI001CE2206A|nr:uncharacterized protein LOC122882710 isoform X2 [Siniperca chuatsi]
MMWGVTLVFFSYVASLVTSNDIIMECLEFHDFPPTNSASPSFLADLKVEGVTVEQTCMLNISWAINIDASIEYLTGTRIVIEAESTYHCKYNPPLAKTNLTGSMQKWFHYLVKASYGSTNIQVANLPLPFDEHPYKLFKITVPRPEQRVKRFTPQVPIVELTTSDLRKEVPGNINITYIAVAIFGGLASVMILSSCYIVYKVCGANVATSLGFKRLPTSPMVPVPVLVVYPAENSAFQQAVVALAEFLQWQGGCKVAVDMWQQGKIAELGPMRWLAEQAGAADRVLIVCPQVAIPSSQLRHSPPNHSFPEPSIPAAAHDLYPLILNMVASHAKSASNLAKFWVVQLGEQQDKTPSNLALELRACKTFCLMNDLNKLCRSLHTQRQDDKISDLTFRPGIAHSEKSTMKLREAVEKLGRHQPSIFRQVELLKSVVTTI